MNESERRTAISTSQLGLYSDHSDRDIRSRYSSTTRKFAIGVMVVVAVILIGIFLYDFTNATTLHSKVNQETKHKYILQNALKKPTNVTLKFSNSTHVSEVNRTNPVYIQDRSDHENSGYILSHEDTDRFKESEAEQRSQNLNNFKLRRRVLKSVDNNAEESPAEGKQLFDNHAVVYRLRQRYKYPGVSEDEESSEESRPTPFHWELKTPQPTSFKRIKYPQLSQYRYPHSSRNIQDIIKYLTHDAEVPNRGIKFTGVYVNPKKYDMVPDIGEMMANSDRSEEEDSYSNDDPFYQYKPKHPADVNLLATSNVRFAPTGLHRYNPYYDLYGKPINYMKQPPSAAESQYEPVNPYAANYAKKRKPKPFSVMLDIYPITDIMEQNKKNSRPKQVVPDDYDIRRPIQLNRVPKFYATAPQSMGGLPNQAMSEEEERQQMIFHLNLYPKKKNRMNRHDIIHRSESMAAEERQQFVNKVWSPLETIAKHLAVERSKFMEDDEPTSLASTRYQETVLDNKNESKHEQRNDSSGTNGGDSEEIVTVPANHKSSAEEDYASTEKYEFEALKLVGTTEENEKEERNTTLAPDVTTVVETKTVEVSKDVDTVEGFKRFSDSVSKTN